MTTIEKLRSRPAEFYEMLFAKMRVVGIREAAFTLDGVRMCDGEHLSFDKIFNRLDEEVILYCFISSDEKIVYHRERDTLVERVYEA